MAALRTPFNRYRSEMNQFACVVEMSTSKDDQCKDAQTADRTRSCCGTDILVIEAHSVP